MVESTDYSAGQLTSDEASGSVAPVAEPIGDERRPGLLKRMFVNRFQHLRAGWRLLIYFLVVALLAVPLNRLLALLDLAQTAEHGSMTHPVVLLGNLLADLVLVVAALIVLRWVDRRPVRLLGLDLRSGWLRELSLGLAGGLVLISLPSLLLLAVGSISVAPASDLAASLSALPGYLALFVLAGALEELLFRGYLLQALAEGTRPWFAVALLSSLFGIGHLANPDVTALAAINIMLAGVMLSLAYLKTRRLWLPIGLHLSWNLCQSWLWGFDVSGVAIKQSLLELQPTGSALVNGGAFGLEGSLVATVLLTLVSVWLLRTRLLQPVAAMADLWAKYPPGLGLAPAVHAVSPEPDPVDQPGESTVQH